MKYYKTQTEIRAIEEGQEFLIQSDWVELSDEELQAHFAPTESELQSQANSEALSALSSGDWQVIRELERKFLSDTELNKEREALRASIVKE